MHGVISTLAAPDYDAKVVKAYRLTAVETYPLTHLWRAQRHEAMAIEAETGSREGGA